MADTAYQIQYRNEFIAGFEQKQSLLRDTVTTEAVIKGNQAVFLVADSGGAEATTRGTNGLIPARADNNVQSTATLREWHDLARKTGFNIFASQGNQRQIMQETTMGTLNPKIDQDIIAQLATATNDTGAVVTGSVALFQKARVILGVNSVPWDSNITLLCTPALLAYLEQAPEFANAQYVDMRPYAGDTSSWRDRAMAYRWRNCLIVEHPNLPGVGTAAEVCYLYHKNAIGHAFDTGSLVTAAGYDEEQDYSFARATAFMGSVLLQNQGVVVINHDGSAFAAS